MLGCFICYDYLFVMISDARIRWWWENESNRFDIYPRWQHELLAHCAGYFYI